MDIQEFLLARIAEDEDQADSCRTLGWFPAKKYGMTTVSHERVLAECAAKRAILVEHEPQEVAIHDRATWAKPFIVCRRCAIWGRHIVAPCPALKSLSAVYADHPDYQQGWKP